MVAVVTRMRLLKTLLNIKYGPGGAVLPSEISRIHLQFAMRSDGGHFGPRKFWQQSLTRLKYWNPGVPMIVNRGIESSQPAKLSIYIRTTDSPTSTSTSSHSKTSGSTTKGDSKAPPPAEGERVLTIDMTGKKQGAILRDFMAKTGAVLVSPTPDEQAEMAEFKRIRERGNEDRVIMAAYRDGQKREKVLLERAKAEAAAMKAGN